MTDITADCPCETSMFLSQGDAGSTSEWLLENAPNQTHSWISVSHISTVHDSRLLQAASQWSNLTEKLKI
jgi:hypothetical protein